MPCYHPLIGVDVGTVKATGKRSISVIPGSRVSEWNLKRDNIVPLPCGRCIGCCLVVLVVLFFRLYRGGCVGCCLLWVVL